MVVIKLVKGEIRILSDDYQKTGSVKFKLVPRDVQLELLNQTAATGGTPALMKEDGKYIGRPSDITFALDTMALEYELLGKFRMRDFTPDPSKVY